MGKKQEDGSLTPCVANPQIPRINGDGFYQEGDRIIAFDAVGNQVRAGRVGVTGSDGLGKDYMVVQYGDDPFIEAFICTASDVRETLPDPEDAEQLEAWLESGA